MPGGEVQVEYFLPISRFAENTEGIWPYLKGKDGVKIDLRRIQSENSGINEVLNVRNLKDGKTSIFNLKKKLGFELSWDLKAFRNNSIWHVCNGDDSYPRYGKNICFGLYAAEW